MTRRTQVTAALVVLIAFGVAAAFFLLRDGSEENSALAAMSNRGTPIEMEIPERLGPWGDVTGEATLIAERGDIRFLRLPRKDGSSCWATSEEASGFWSITGYACETGFVRFPDRERPVMVIGIQQAVGNRLISYQRFAGFAADAVKRIGVIDAQNRLIQVTGVVDNVFFTPEPPEEIKRVVALDATGEIIWRGPEVPLPDE
jgi:hypothetical protein